MDTSKFKNGGAIATQKEIEQEEIINVLSTACLKMDSVMKTTYDQTGRNLEIKAGSPAYYLNMAIELINTKSLT